MTLLAVIPDAEVLVGAWLRTHPQIIALEANVAPRTPSSTVKPWIRVTQHRVRSQIGHEHLIAYDLQLDCYAGNAAMADFAGHAEASLLHRTARAVLTSKQGMRLDGVVVTSVEFEDGHRDEDTSTEPARPVFITFVEVMLHAV